jgi:hypothetical protein
MDKQDMKSNDAKIYLESISILTSELQRFEKFTKSQTRELKCVHDDLNDMLAKLRD